MYEELKRVICIMKYQNSGSCMMLSLFENHPSLIVIPDNMLGVYPNFFERT